MKPRHFPERWGYCAMFRTLVLVLGAIPASAREWGPTTREQAEDFLRALVDTESVEPRVAAALEGLDAEAYPERLRATAALLREPSLPEDLLEKASAAGSADLRLRLEQIRAFNGPDRKERLFIATLRMISEKHWVGFGPAILRALENEADEKAMIREAMVPAMEATATGQDAEVLRRALESSGALARGAALVGLIAVGGGEFREEIAALAADPEPLNALRVADFLREHEDRRCVPSYVALLGADSFPIRLRAFQALRALTGKTFGYEADGRMAQRWIAQLCWRSWLEKDGPTAELAYGKAVEQAVVLFDGRTLAGWREIGQDGGSGWKIQNGSLVCTGERNARGYLRTEGAYRDFHLRLEYRLPGGTGDSGVGLFMQGDDLATPPCLEVQVLEGKTGDLYRIGDFKAHDGRARPIQFQKAREGEPAERRGDWNAIECVVQGGTLEVRLNGTVVNHATRCPDGEGRILLRNEGDRVEFRNLVLTPIQP